MNNLSFMTLSGAINSDKQYFYAILNKIIGEKVNQLNEQELRNAFFPDLQDSMSKQMKIMKSA